MRVKQVFLILCLIGTNLLYFCTPNKENDHDHYTFDSAKYDVTLQQAHKGTLEIDTMLLDSYVVMPKNIKNFYVDARSVFSNPNFTNPLIVKSAQENNLPLMGGPMLGQLHDTSISIWLRAASDDKITVNVSAVDTDSKKTYEQQPVEPGKV